MRAFNLKLERALKQGAILAALTVNGCGGSSDGPKTTGAAGGGSEAGGSSVAGGSSEAGGGSVAGGSSEAGGSSVGGGGSEAGGSGVLVSALSALPSDATACTGASYPLSGTLGYHGQCCGQVKCLAAESGKCAPADAADLGSFGSGQCLCGAGKAGPYARDPADSTSAPGDCCYVVQAIGCDGRPLLVEGEALISEINLRSDWLARELLELLAA